MIVNPQHDIELFAEAVQLSGAERISFLDHACAGDLSLRRRIDALLKSNDRAGAFLEEPATGAIREERARLVAWEKAGDRVGRYKLVRQIGEGGCGVVFMAEQEAPVHRRVALKVIKPGMDTKSVIARFEAERQALAMMDHCNIAKIFDAGTTDSGRPYFAMELVEGIKITEYCDKHALPTDARLKLFAEVCHAVQHAHQKGIIHRDIKPSNILVTTTGEGFPVPMIIDFGIAKATTNQPLTDKTLFTALEMLIGTPVYMSPEQTLSGADIDTRTDIYSLGVLLYELLTGATPFDDKELLKVGVDEIRRVIREKDPPPPSTRLSRMSQADLTNLARTRHSEPPTLIRSVRGDLDWIVMKALEKDRARRYCTANGLAMDIQRFLAHETISARPPSKRYRLQKAVQRNRLLFASAASIAVLVIAGLIIVSAALAKERLARKEAENASRKSRQVTKFLEAMLRAAGPSAALGDDTKLLKRILDQTAERIDGELADQPRVQAELRSVIGGVYGELGDPVKGEKMARQALDINRREFGPQSREAAASLYLLGEQLMGQYKRPEAAKAHLEALAIRRRLLGEEHIDTAASLSKLAAVYVEEEKVAEAEAMTREALRIWQKAGGKHGSELADLLRSLCMALGHQEKWVEAEDTARKALQMRRELYGPQHPSVAGALHDLAWTVGAARRFSEAESLEAEAALMQEKFLGDAHPDVSITMNSLGGLLGDQGDKHASEAVLKAVLSIQRKMLSEDHPATLETLCSLAQVLEKEWKRPEAESMWREALERWNKRSEDDDPNRLYALRGLGENLESQGKWSGAQEVWRDSLALWRKRGGIEERQSMFTLRKLGLALEAGQNWPEAENIYREALTISGKKGEDDPEAMSDLEKLIRILMLQKKFVEARQLLKHGLTSEAASKSPGIGLLTLRVNVLGREGRWQEAATNAVLAMQNQSGDHYSCHTLAAILAMVGDRSGYEQVCKDIVSKFANANNPYVAERVAQDNLLLPDSGADLALMDRLADKAVATGGGTDGFPYFQACKAMSQYRLRHFPESLIWAEKASQSSAPFAQAKGYAILAMAHWQLGHESEARTALAQGDALAPRISTAVDGVDLGESWVAWLMARISLDEASKLIGD